VEAVIADHVKSGTLVISRFLGEYDPGAPPREERYPESGLVRVFMPAVAGCASALSVSSRHLGTVVLIHETIHALSHVGRDLDGHMWNEFAQPPALDRLYAPSWLHETIAQYFTNRFLTELGDSKLLSTFQRLGEHLHPAYQAWRHIAHLPVEDVRAWWMGVRRGVGGDPAVHRLVFTDQNLVGQVPR
jgi:hypothetical protein